MNSPIPLIDFGPFIDGSDKSGVAHAIDSACRDIGFLVLTGHGVALETIAKTNAVSERFFALPDEQKMQYYLRTAAKGYIPPGGETLEQTLDKAEKAPNPYEAFAIGPRTGPQDTELSDNLWPSEPSDLQTIWLEYYQALEALATQLMQAFALSLGLAEHHFDRLVDQHASYLRATRYPELDTPLPRGQVRAGEHCDYGSLTILWTQAPGLQIQCDGEWQDVPVLPEGLIVNLGNLMATWTNDRWCSTLHRVVPYFHDGVAPYKSSLVFFHIPNWDAEIACLPNCMGADNPAKYPPVTTGDFVMDLIAKQYT